MAHTGPPPPQSLIDGIAVSYTVACAFFTDPEGKVLLVKPNYRDDWAFVGGLVDKGESPHEACARETKEEIGLDVPPGELLVLDWVPMHEFVSAPLTFYLFDGGVIDDPGRIRLQADELDEFGFFQPERAAVLSAEVNPGRVDLALRARRTGRTAYQPSHRSA
ncbi:NUDIX domain-containing protein [Glycomyces tenuis]|uniref:NUDIX domain-containing protein n=1 Tax=Glycomyces tenuis TaxID=58116 RepID=UPI0004270CBD|nr:NUDIX hydrolase [Glycomyces tenuis]